MTVETYEAPSKRTPRSSGEAVQAPLETYLREINETPLLAAKQEKELALRVEIGDSRAREQMVRANLRLVVNIARGYARRGLPLEDLIEEGNLGLLRAVEKFDPGMNTRFSTYASYWIKQSIRRALVNSAKSIRIPAYMVDLLSKWRRATERLQRDLGRAPTQEEVRRRLNLSKKRLTIIDQAIRISNSATQTERIDSAWTVQDTSKESEAPETKLMEADELRQVMRFLERMDKRRAAVLRLRFGLNNDEPLTLREIGEKLGLTRERVRQIETEALKELAQGLPQE